MIPSSAARPRNTFIIHYLLAQVNFMHLVFPTPHPPLPNLAATLHCNEAMHELRLKNLKRSRHPGWVWSRWKPSESEMFLFCFFRSKCRQIITTRSIFHANSHSTVRNKPPASNCKNNNTREYWSWGAGRRGGGIGAALAVMSRG